MRLKLKDAAHQRTQARAVCPTRPTAQWAFFLSPPVVRATCRASSPRSAVSTVDASQPSANPANAGQVAQTNALPDALIVERDWEAELEELLKLVSLLPPSVRVKIEEHSQMPDLLEVVMDLGRPPLARFPSGDVKLSEEAITQEDLDYAVRQVGEFGGDNRAGINRTLHRISALRNRAGRIIGLTCRAGRAIRGSAEMVADLVLSGASILFLGRPGVGKTTAIREVSRSLADDLQRRVVIVDTSNEIGGDGDIPHEGIGRARRMQVPNPEEQHRVMIEAVENHMPEVVVIDEIGTEAECAAARTIAQRGVQLVATAHGNELDNVVKNPSLSDLVGGVQSVTLGDEEARKRGVQKSILERGGPPTFDVAVEILERQKWRVHLDVAHAVDLLLAGGVAGGQVRERAADGTILRYNYNPLVSSVMASPTRDMRTSSSNSNAANASGTQGSSSGPQSARAARAAAAAALAAREAAETAAANTSGLAAFTRPLGSVPTAAPAASQPSTSPRPAATPVSSSPAASPTSSQSQDWGDMEALAAAAVPRSAGRSSFARPNVHAALEEAAAAAEAEEGDDGVEPQEGARRLANRQALIGVDPEGVVLRLFPYELDADKLWEVMTAMDLVDKVLVVRRVSAADAVLGLRSKVKSDASLRQAAKESRVPIYAVKAGGTGNLVRGLRTLLGLDPSAGGAFVRTTAANMGSSIDESTGDESIEDSAGRAPAVSGSLRAEQDIARLRASKGSEGGAPSRLAALRAHEAVATEALEEARVACEEIVGPLRQQVELLPRPLPVLQEQMQLVSRYQLGFEVIAGKGNEQPRLRILPASKH